MDRDEIKEVEVALIDGVVRSKEDEERLKEARGKSRFLIAWGTCASFGGIPAMANPFELEELIEESYGQSLDPFSYYLSGTKGVTSVFYAENGLELLRTAHKIDDFVNVDYYIPGCPPPIKLVTQMIMELKGEPNAAPRRNIVCSECSRKFVKNTDDCFLVFPRQGWEQSQCFSSRGLCMGFMTRGGCGASCPSGALPCWGCRGPSDAVLNKISRGQSLESSMLESISRRNNLGGEKIKPVMDIIRRRSNSLISFYQNFNIDSSKIR
jgi:F420-non-reducing hydrogenase small subunit